jgi:hypothetical protein
LWVKIAKNSIHFVEENNSTSIAKNRFNEILNNFLEKDTIH